MTLTKSTIATLSTGIAAGLMLCLSAGSATADQAKPTTTQCLGDLDKLLTCPTGYSVRGEAKAGGARACVADKANRNAFPPRKRQGPSVWYHVKSPTAIHRVGNYVDHEKHGRHYYFDRAGVLTHIRDYKKDDYHGLYVECYDNGQVATIQNWVDGKSHGITRRWERSGKLKYATEYRWGKRIGRVSVSAADQRAPANLCRPRVCDLNTPTGSLR